MLAIVREGLLVVVIERDAVSVATCDRVVVGEAVLTAVRVTEADGVPERVDVLLPDVLGTPVAVPVRVAERLVVMVVVVVFEPIAVAEIDADGVLVRVALKERVGVAVPEPDRLMDAERVPGADRVGVLVPVVVRERVGLPVGVRVPRAEALDVTV